ncbi:hypothetical protein C9374_012535 [Naegleria lovaniensis]|uniref:Uncharacterized protein n=1 Tax=Naegleria lovaniensis TaxID=51637 RepID=A0AA88GWF9_NAELO|nr:uncharacterized protein C9374_012535 [Naegleria lovaniensis]KAG2392283.1 hypothetical protein C9374_012535 [Naegleria lovaniensis]
MDQTEEAVATPLSCLHGWYLLIYSCIKVDSSFLKDFKHEILNHIETTTKELQEMEEEYQALKRFIQTEIDSCSEDQNQLLQEAENVQVKIAAFLKNLQCHLPMESLSSRKYNN